MKVTLVRHGRSTYRAPRLIPGSHYRESLRAYDEAGIRADSRPPTRLVDLAREAGVVVSSPVRRAIESAHRLVDDGAFETDPLFVEAALPHAFPSALHLPTGVWAATSRIAWFCGWSPEVESHAHTRERARRAAEALRRHGRDHGTVLLVGHHFMNSFVATELRRSGMRSEGRLSGFQTHNWWSVTFVSEPGKLAGSERRGDR